MSITTGQTNRPALPLSGEPKRTVKFSAELAALAARFGDRPVRLGDLFEATQGRGINLLLVFMTLPFLTPIPLPGVSVFFGVVIALIGARLAVGRKPRLPDVLLRREMPPKFASRVLRAAVRVVRWLEYLLKPRYQFVHERLLFQCLGGTLILISGLLLVLPLPLPFSNSLPGFTVLLVAAGAMERDGLFFVAGAMMFLVSAAYFGILAIGGVRLFESLWRAIAGA